MPANPTAQQTPLAAALPANVPMLLQGTSVDTGNIQTALPGAQQKTSGPGSPLVNTTLKQLFDESDTSSASGSQTSSSSSGSSSGTLGSQSTLASRPSFHSLGGGTNISFDA